MTSSHQDATSCQWFSYLASALDRRSAPRLVRLFLGALLARGRRTVTSWIRAAGLSRQYQPCYTTVAAAGKQADNIAARLVYQVVKPLVAGQTRLTLALDDTPTQRVRALRAGGRHPSQSDPRPGWRTASLRPHLGRARAAWRSILHGESSPCRCFAGCTSGRRTCRASTRSIGPSSGPSWRWASSCSGWLGPGCGLWASRCGWSSTAPTPRPPSSSQRCRWG